MNPPLFHRRSITSRWPSSIIITTITITTANIADMMNAALSWCLPDTVVIGIIIITTTITIASTAAIIEIAHYPTKNRTLTVLFFCGV